METIGTDAVFCDGRQTNADGAFTEEVIGGPHTVSQTQGEAPSYIFSNGFENTPYVMAPRAECQWVGVQNLLKC